MTATGLRADVAVDLGDLRLRASLHVAAGTTVALVGPNGAGKTTLLRALAGLQPLSGGRVELDGVVLDDTASGTWLPPEQRGVAVVFQDARLFPHLSVLGNVAFGPRSQGVRRRAAAERAAGWLARVGAADLAGVRPTRLSGGQVQRVALARALAAEPRMVLLDEPLSALDVAGRPAVRRDLLRHLGDHAGVRIVVTHDPLEAAALASRLVVLEAGAVVQEGTLDDIARRPASPWAAELAGVNRLAGHGRGDRIELAAGGVLAVAGARAGPVVAVVHPRSVALHRNPPEGTPRNVWPVTVESVDRQGGGGADRVRVRVAGTVPLVAEVTAAAVADLGLEPGQAVWASVKATEIDVHPA